MVTNSLSQFIKSKLEYLDSLGIEYSGLELDHFGYQCSSTEDYNFLKEESKKIGELRNEAIVGGRHVAIFENKCPIQVGSHLVSGFELVEPKEGQECNSQLDHIEFVWKGTFESLLEKYPKITFDTTAKNRDEFPKVAIKLEDGTSIKFHLMNILQEI